MNGKVNRLCLRLFKVVNVIMMAMPFAIVWMGFYLNEMKEPYFRVGNIVVVLLMAVLYIIIAHIYDAFYVSLQQVAEMIYSQALSVFIVDAMMYVVVCLLLRKLPAVWPMFLVLVVQVLFSAVWCYMSHTWYFKVYPPKKTLVVYDQREGIGSLLGEYGLNKKFDVKNTIDVNQCIDSGLVDLKGMEAVFLCGIHSHERNIILKYCVRNSIMVYVIPRVGDVIMSSAKKMHMLHLPMLKVGRYAPSAEYRFAKRTFDIIVCGLALIILSPVFIITAIAIKMTDGGPVFYKQCRLTQNGKTFDVLKFRSMRVDAEKDGVARLSTGDKDDRVTAVGKIIRKVRIDELPQLLNIIKGDMSIVGPRPERPEIAKQYEEELPEFALRLQAKAGLTGYAQVYGKYNTTPYDKLQMDLMYIAKPSFIEDLRIIMATIKIILIPESTEGVAEGQTTASSGSKQ